MQYSDKKKKKNNRTLKKIYLFQSKPIQVYQYNSFTISDDVFLYVHFSSQHFCSSFIFYINIFFLFSFSLFRIFLSFDNFLKIFFFYFCLVEVDERKNTKIDIKKNFSSFRRQVAEHTSNCLAFWRDIIFLLFSWNLSFLWSR